MPPRVLVLRAAGTNCDEETAFAWTLAGATAERVHFNRLVEEPGRLFDFDVFTIPGGFSYGDDIASGKILAVRLGLHLGDDLREFVRRGRLVLGICNGFQVLVKAGLLPGPGLPAATLTFNDSGQFEARWVPLRARPSPCVFLEPGEVFWLPVAHGEGKFVLASEAEPHRPDATAFSALKAANCLALTYGSNAAGPAAYPENPNGSEFDVAGVCDPTGRVFGLMPHPERAALPVQQPAHLRNGSAETAGLRMFRRAVASLR